MNSYNPSLFLYYYSKYNIIESGDTKSTQAPNDRVKRQSRRQEESEIHPNLIRYIWSNNDDSLLSNPDPASTSRSIIISAKNA